MTYDHKETLDLMVMSFRHFATIASCVPQEQIDRAKETVSTADSIGFLLDPTAYRKALFSGSLDRQRELVQLFDDVRTKLKTLFPEGWPEDAGVTAERI